MRHSGLVLLFILLLIGVAFSCKKWSDPAPVSHPEIANPYCNDPEAVNYNWGFPGRPDNTTCYYASDLFAGTYFFHDTVYDAKTDLYLSADSGTLILTKISKHGLSVSGLCPSDRLLFTTQGAYIASADTTVGDSLTVHRGQIFCKLQDTLTGSFTRDKVDSALIYINLTVVNDTGATVHIGKAVKK